MCALERDLAFERLRTRLPPTVKAVAAPGLRSSGLPGLDAVLGGGLLPGSLVTIEGALGGGGSGLLARLIATITEHEQLVALLEQPRSPQGRYDPASLAAAGVALERLFFVHVDEALGLARACDLLIRAGNFALVALPMVEMRTQVWTRLAQLAHRHACVLVVLGQHAPSELRFCATVRLRCETAQVQWSGLPGIFSCLHDAHIDITVEKNKLAAPGGRLRLRYAHETRRQTTTATRVNDLTSTLLPLRLQRRA